LRAILEERESEFDVGTPLGVGEEQVEQVLPRTRSVLESEE
jgi:hypothetical protein